MLETNKAILIEERRQDGNSLFVLRCLAFSRRQNRRIKGFCYQHLDQQTIQRKVK